MIAWIFGAGCQPAKTKSTLDRLYELDYYGLLYSQLAVGLSVEMLDSKTGEVLWRVQDARRDHTVRIAFDPVGVLVGLFQAGFALRPINMMRAMDEISRELVGTLPPVPGQ